jgi:hypothetical protein
VLLQAQGFIWLDGSETVCEKTSPTLTTCVTTATLSHAPEYVLWEGGVGILLGLVLMVVISRPACQCKCARRPPVDLDMAETPLVEQAGSP